MAKEKAWLIRDSAEGIFSAGAAAVGKPFRRPFHQMQERLRTEAQNIREEQEKPSSCSFEAG
ncbi:hypothetical protein DFS30_05520 [Akkermansia muciniphila]|jgi:FMN phosphatase YigB (HAD superfamily)|nr:hypothetical protein CUC06_05480 [Akkermansia muciniphila]OLA88720.1 MAG: hypothetical protein BHW66_07580 [Akkermansia sp. 54_46]MBD9262124.1 hypothetical protein [Akkermansia muciniphila]PNC45118.1 hypothetical protein CXU08_03450 [Akkermansia muciniphila]PNC54502.1 hypothetical protein CXU06_06925 [Akkermansia muciniphila]